MTGSGLGEPLFARWRLKRSSIITVEPHVQPSGISLIEWIIGAVAIEIVVPGFEAFRVFGQETAEAMTLIALPQINGN